MQICVVTSDRDLRNLLFEIAESSLVMVLPSEILPSADLYLWDFDPESGFPDPALFGEARTIFLAQSEHLSILAAQNQDRAFTTLLKPLGSSALKTLISNYHREWKSSAGVQSLRSDRDVLLQHVLAANLRLREYDQERTNFLARALHDLRTPLMALHGFCALLLDGKVGPLRHQQQELVSKMYRSARRLMRLSRGMFELAVEGRVERTLRPEPTDLESCVKQALHELSAVVEEKSLQVTAQIEPAPGTLFAEVEQIEQLLINLIENACKFTPRSGEIQIHGYPVYYDAANAEGVDATLEGPHRVNAYRVDVRDSGPGITSEALSTIFEQYTSYGGPADRSGGGLGLAIAKRIVSLHGGRIWASSTEGGATLSFILPLEPPVRNGRHGPAAEVAAQSHGRVARGS